METIGTKSVKRDLIFFFSEGQIFIGKERKVHPWAKGGRKKFLVFYRKRERVEIRNKEVVLNINFYLLVLLGANSDPGHERDKKLGGEGAYMKVHLHEYIFKTVSINILGITGFQKLTI